MQKAYSFKAILDEKLSSTGFQGDSQSIEIDNSPAHMAFLLGLMGTRTLKHPHPPRPRTGQPYAPKKPTPRPAHQMDAHQYEAFFFILRWAGSLNENFSSQDLKQAFRKAALQLHPDQGGCANLFLKLKADIKTLEALLLQKTP